MDAAMPEEVGEPVDGDSDDDEPRATRTRRVFVRANYSQSAGVIALKGGGAEQPCMSPGDRRGGKRRKAGFRGAQRMLVGGGSWSVELKVCVGGEARLSLLLSSVTKHTIHESRGVIHTEGEVGGIL